MIAASKVLREFLSQIMLRRTSEDILKLLLPPRLEYILYCKLNHIQQREYQKIAAEIGMFTSDENVTRDESINNTTFGSTVLPILMKLRQICNSAGNIYEEEGGYW